MCHLYCKAAALGEMDTKANSPIFVLLSKVYRQSEPNLGNFWMVRLQHIPKLQTLLEGLPQIAPVKSLLESIDRELLHVRKTMAAHPVHHGSGRFHELKTNVTPSGSMSVEIRRERELLEKRAKADDGKKRTRGEEEMESPGSSDKSGSDLEPPAGLILHSIRKVDTWMEDCNDTISEAAWQDDDASMVSAIDGGVNERPRVNPATVWKHASKRSRTHQRTSSKNSAIGASNIDKSNQYKVHNTKISDCVYSKPQEGVKMGIRAISINIRKKGYPEAELGPDNKDAEKLSQRCISIKGGIRSLRDRVLSKEPRTVLRGKSPAESTRRVTASGQQALIHSPSRIIMAGGRSPGGFARRQQDSVKSLTNSSQSGSSLGGRRDDSVRSRCQDMWINHFDEWEAFDSSPSSLLSSRSSATNLGSIMRQFPLSKRASDSSTTSWMKPSPPKTRASPPTGPPVAIGRAPSPSICRISERREVSDSKTETSKHEEYNKYLTPAQTGQTRTTGRPLPPLPPEAERALTRSSFQEARGVRHGNAISDAVKESRRRRGERAERGVPFTDRYRKEAREKAWTSQRSYRELL